MDMKKSLEQYINQKSVVFVGPSPAIQGMRFASWIDSFDVVIRTNGAANLVEKDWYQKDYGQKCNVLCMNSEFMRFAATYNLDSLIQYHWLQAILLKRYELWRFKGYESKLSILPIGNPLNLTHAPFMGTIVISIFASLNPSELWLTGMDFYTRNSRYLDGYLPTASQEVKEKNIRKRKKEGVRLHNPAEDREYLYNLYLQGSVYLDSVAKRSLLSTMSHAN